MSNAPAIQEILQPEEMTPKLVSQLAREHTETAVGVLVDIANSRQAPDSARVLAANSLLDRGHGKPPQAVLVAEQRQAIDYSDPAIRRNLARKIAFYLGGQVPE